MRIGELKRATKETDITVRLNLDGSGATKLNTGIGFFDHMLNAMARFGLMDLEVSCKGDLYVDGHHTVEDVGICIGKAIKQAVGDKAGINRVGHAYIPMDEALAFAALDLSARPVLVFQVDFASNACGQMDTQLCEEFFRAVAQNSGLTLHLQVPYGKNDHHKMEALFKAFGKALSVAVDYNTRILGVHSTKGTLEE